MTTVKNTIIFLTISFLFSCSSTNKNTEQTTIINSKTKDTLISFTGYWLDKDYFESINKFKSPKKAQDNSELIFIPDRTLKQTMMISNFHEGGPSLTILKNKDQYELWEFQEDSLTQRLEKIEILDKTNIKIGHRLFVKINPVKDNNDSKILEDILFKGIYTNSNDERIEFKNNGQVTGLGKYKTYVPAIDYYDAGMQVDQIGLGISSDYREWLGFKFNIDTLNLYQLNCLTYDSTENRCLNVNFGQLKYKLWLAK